MRHWPGGSDARRVLVAAGTWLAASRRGTQRLPGLRGGAAVCRMGTGVPAPRAGCATATSTGTPAILRRQAHRTLLAFVEPSGERAARPVSVGIANRAGRPGFHAEVPATASTVPAPQRPGKLAAATLTPLLPDPPGRVRRGRPPAAGRGGDLADRGRSGPPRLRARGRALGQHAVTAIARSLPDYFTSDVARPGTSAAVRRRKASMTSFADRPWHRSSRTVLDPGPAAARSPALLHVCRVPCR